MKMFHLEISGSNVYHTWKILFYDTHLSTSKNSLHWDSKYFEWKSSIWKWMFIIVVNKKSKQKTKKLKIYAYIDYIYTHTTPTPTHIYTKIKQKQIFNSKLSFLVPIYRNAYEKWIRENKIQQKKQQIFVLSK